jgi:2'-hydroxyisoflavone reductase
MKLLILGGTAFVGRHFVEEAMNKGHEVTLFNRGQTNPELFPEIEKLKGDRDGDLEALKGRKWDAVVDVNGYVPRHVRDSATLLKDAVEHYVYISTGSVYEAPFPTNGDESVPIITIEDETNEDVQQNYGALKALCEKYAEEVMPGRTLSLRLGLMAGQYDFTDRATYYAYQIVDARDLANFVMLSLEKQYTGIYNTTGGASTWGSMLDTGKAIGNSDTEFTWIDDHEFLKDNEPENQPKFGAYPLLLPKELGDLWTVNSERAQKLGLVYRPLEETLRDVIEWTKTRPADYQWTAGLSSEQEAALLKKWHAKG